MFARESHFQNTIKIRSFDAYSAIVPWFLYRLTQWTVRNIGRIERGRRRKKKGEEKRSAPPPLYSHNVDLSRFSRRDFRYIINTRRAYERPPVISHIALCSRGAGIRSIGSMCLMPSGSASDAPDTVLVKSACPCRQHGELCMRICPNQAWRSHVSCP